MTLSSLTSTLLKSWALVYFPVYVQGSYIDRYRYRKIDIDIYKGHQKPAWIILEKQKFKIEVWKMNTGPEK